MEQEQQTEQSDDMRWLNGSLQTCLLTRVPIQYEDLVVMVRVARRKLDLAFEGYYFSVTDHFKDVLAIDQGYFDGENSILPEDVETWPRDIKRSHWTLFFHKSAWDLAQRLAPEVTPLLYDPPIRVRTTVQEMHKEAEETTGTKIWLHPAFKAPNFPERILEFARVVSLAWKAGQVLIPPVESADTITGHQKEVLALSTAALMLWAQAQEKEATMQEEVEALLR